MAVCITHWYQMSYKRGLLPLPPQNLVGTAINQLGVYNVALFFCISGLLIIQSLLKHSSITRFAYNRVKRIYPAFIVLHMVMFTAGVAANYEWMGSLKSSIGSYLIGFFSNLLFLPGVFQLPIAQKNAWTLSYEAAFYILSGLCFASLAQKESRPWLMGLGLAAFAGAAGWIIYRAPIAFYFVVGVSACFPLLPFVERVLDLKWLGLILYPVAALVFGSSVIAALPLIGLLFYGVVKEKGLLHDLLQLRVFQFLGTVSYSLYLVHPFVLDVLRTISVKASGKIGAFPAATLFFIAMLILVPGVSYLMYSLIEVKLTKFLFPSKPSASEAAVTS